MVGNDVRAARPGEPCRRPGLGRADLIADVGQIFAGARVSLTNEQAAAVTERTEG